MSERAMPAQKLEIAELERAADRVDVNDHCTDGTRNPDSAWRRWWENAGANGRSYQGVSERGGDGESLRLAAA